MRHESRDALDQFTAGRCFGQGRGARTGGVARQEVMGMVRVLKDVHLGAAF